MISFSTVAVTITSVGGSLFIYMTLAWLRWIIGEVQKGNVRPARR